MKQSPNETRPCQSELGRAGGFSSRLQPAIPRWVAPRQSPTPFHWLTASLRCSINLSSMSVKFFLSSPCLKKPKPNLPDAQSMQSNCVERVTDTHTVCRPTDSAEEPDPTTMTTNRVFLILSLLTPAIVAANLA